MTPTEELTEANASDAGASELRAASAMLRLSEMSAADGLDLVADQPAEWAVNPTLPRYLRDIAENIRCILAHAASK